MMLRQVTLDDVDVFWRFLLILTQILFVLYFPVGQKQTLGEVRN